MAIRLRKIKKPEVVPEIVEAPPMPELPPPIQPAPKKERILIVKELPMQPIRSYVDDDGVTINMMTREEYLTELANSEE